MGTANKGAVLPVKGIGRVGGEEIKWCPDLRKAIISLGRIHSWALSADFPRDGVPILYHTLRGHRQAVLVGQYKNGMPCFELNSILKLARRQREDSVTHVMNGADL